MKIKQIRKNIYHLDFESEYLLSMTFMRMQEFYESPNPKIRGKYFTVEQCMDDYAEREGDFTYTSDFGGFNVPDWVVRKFFKVFSLKGLMDKEAELGIMLLSIIQSGEKFYLIGTNGNPENLNHELAHAYYYLYLEYQRAMNTIISTDLSYYKGFHKLLLKEGYPEVIMFDEVQAYLATSPKNSLMSYLHFNKKWKVPPSFRKFFKLWDKEACKWPVK